MKYLILALIPSISLATVKPEVPPATTATSSSEASSSALSVSGAHATGGHGGNATGGQAVSGGSFSSNAVNITEQRQVPGVAQGSFAIQGCQSAGNAGGSNVGGSAFLGFGYTSAECYSFMLAQAYAAVGQQKTACDVLNSTKAAKRAEKRGVTLPDCAQLAPQVAVIASQKPSESAVEASKPQECASKDHVTETVTKGFKLCASK